MNEQKEFTPQQPKPGDVVYNCKHGEIEGDIIKKQAKSTGKTYYMFELYKRYEYMGTPAKGKKFFTADFGNIQACLEELKQESDRLYAEDVQ